MDLDEYTSRQMVIHKIVPWHARLQLMVAEEWQRITSILQWTTPER